MIDGLGVSREYLDAEMKQQLGEIRRRQESYRRGRSATPVANRTVIVIDDGIATGATVRAGLQALRQQGPAHLVLAVPVAPPETIRALQHEVDEIVCLHAPANFMAVGRFYSDFNQTTDEEVVELLDEATARTSEPAWPA